MAPPRTFPARLRRVFVRTLLFVLLLGTSSSCGGDEGRPLLAATRPPKIRVWVQRRAKRYDLAIQGQAWEMVAAGGRPFIRRASGNLEVTLRAGPRGVALGPEDTGATILRIRSDTSVALNGTHYPGALVIHVHGDGLRCVNETDLETYVAGVIPNEMAPGAPASAYRAQAIAARTFGWIKVHGEASKARIYDVYDDQSSQVYTGIDPRYEVDYGLMKRLAGETSGVILTWRSQPFPAYYSSTCGGHTTDARTSRLDPGGAEVPLRGVKCEFCRESRKYAWTKAVSDADVIKGMKARGRPISPPIHAIEVSRKGAGTWAAEVTITHGKNRTRKKLPGTEFRSALRLDSHHILGIRRKGKGWEVKGRGWGHGVGFCQMGGVGMARRGFSHSEILSWYYPGAMLTRLY